MKISDNVNLNEIYDFQLGFKTPWFFEVDFEIWKEAFEADTDGDGRVLFKELDVKGVYDEEGLAGFVQYGRTAFGFDEKGEISDKVSYPVIRNLYFRKENAEAGRELLGEALRSFEKDERVYAFFHYFGMTCFARHGKLFESCEHIGTLLSEAGFETEHENVYYSSVICGKTDSEIELVFSELSEGNHQYIEFKLDGAQVGGCEVHYLSDTTAYLRWIYVNGDITGKGIGTKCMNSLKNFLFDKGVVRFDTDTALDNLVAQHYYEKNGFTREGISRSFYINR